MIDFNFYFLKHATQIERMYKLRDWVPLNNIDWLNLSQKPPAIHLLEANANKVNWFYFTQNPAIFIPDYAAMSASRQELHDELISGSLRRGT